jgi:CheY-like chemotaxis protein/HPt (histidine-containing phosphotransfer) domain-containing protein
MLESFGCRVEVTSNGQEALDALSKTLYDLVFMDCQMPEVDGYEATRIFRAREAQRPENRPGRIEASHHTPIIAMTAHAMQGDREQCLAAGMDDYLSKPFNRNRLFEVLKRWLPSKSTTDVMVRSHIEGSTLVDQKEQRQARACRLLLSGPGGGSEPQGEAFLDRLSHLEHLNYKTLESLRSSAREGRPNLLQRVIRLYMESSPKLVDDVRQSITSCDAAALQRSAHALKSTSGNLGAMRVVELCKELETMGREGASENATTLLPVLEVEYERLCEALVEEQNR